MAGELFQKPGAEEQKSAFEQAGQDLRQNQVEDGDTKDQIQAKVDRLGKTRLSLEAAYNKAEAAQKYDETPKLFAMTAQVDEGIAALQKAQEQAPYKETPVSERKMERGEERQKTVDELKADIQEQSKVIDDPKKSAEEKQAAQEKRAEAQKELKVLGRKEGRDEAMATVAKYKAEEAKSRAEDAVRLAELEQELEGKSPDEAKAAVEGTTETSDGQAKQADQKSPDQSRPERKGSFGERADRLVKGTLLEILGHPPKTPFEKFTTSSKVLMIRFALAFGGGARREWMKDLREPQKNILKKITGLVITPRANPKDGEPLFDLDWGEPDKEYLGPSKTTQDVFAKYFTENEWLSVYDRVASLNEGKATVAQVKASFATPPSSDDQWLQKLMDDLGAQDGDVFLDAVSKRGYSLLDSDKPAQSPAGPAEEQAEVQLLDETETLFTQVSIKCVQEKKYNSQTKMREFFKGVMPDLMEAWIDSPQFTTGMQKVVSILFPKEKLTEMIQQNTSLKAEEKEAFLQTVEETGVLPLEFIHNFKKDLIEKFKIYAQSPEFDAYMRGQTNMFAMSAPVSQTFQKDITMAQFIRDDIAAGRGVSQNQALLDALMANDEPDQNPSSPSAQ